MGDLVRVLLVGVGGYGNSYVNELLNDHSANVSIVGIVDPKPEGCERFSEIQNQGIPVFDCISEFYQGHSADLAVISSPIPFHREQVCFALENQSHVLCEKPLSASIVDAYAMIDKHRESNKFLAVGYQWSYSAAIQKLKHDISKGFLGAPKRFKTLIMWPRDKHYYARSWAGRRTDGHGNLVLDSVANNATAHYLHNMFYVLGSKPDTSVLPVQVEAELYRMNDIEMYDTAAARIITENDVELMYYATHATTITVEPQFTYEFEEASVEFHAPGNIIAHFRDGLTKDYGDPFADVMRKLWLSVGAVYDQEPVLCPAEATLSHIMTIHAMEKSMPSIQHFPSELHRYDSQAEIKWVYGLSDALSESYSSNKLPSECGVLWAKKGKMVEVKSEKAT